MVLDATTCDRGGIGAIPQPPDPGEPPWSWDRVGVDHSTPTASRVTKTQSPRPVEVDRLVTLVTARRERAAEVLTAPDGDDLS